MATFTKLDQLTDHAKYKLLLKTAMAKVKAAPVKFTYFEKFKFGEKTFPLMLVDHDPALLLEIRKKTQPTALGKCKLNPTEELVFEPETGKLNRVRLKRYLSTFGGIKPVWVPDGEKDEGDEKESEDGADSKPNVHATGATGATATAASQKTSEPNPRAATQTQAPNVKTPTAAEMVAKYNGLIETVKEAAAAHPTHKDELAAAFSAIPGLVKTGALQDAQKAFDRVGQMLNALKNEPHPTDQSARTAAMQEWLSARKKVIEGLQELEAKIRDMGDDEGEAAIVLVKAIQGNITEKPGTRQQITELENYLKSDSIIAEAEAPNGFGITLKIKEPLLAALSKLKPQLAA